MNTTPNPDRDKLDRLLDETLKDFPEMQAPESLLGNVMARVAEEEEKQQLSWFARLQWPVVAVSAFFIFFATYFGDDAVRAIMTSLNTEQYAGDIQNVNVFIQLIGTVLSAAAKVVNLVPSVILYSVIFLVIGISSFSCAGLNTVHFRLTRNSNLLSNHL
jgi:hypothetical protein